MADGELKLHLQQSQHSTGPFVTNMHPTPRTKQLTANKGMPHNNKTEHDMQQQPVCPDVNSNRQLDSSPIWGRTFSLAVTPNRP